jgi:hypothetical protein
MSGALEELGHDDAQRLTERIRLSLDSVAQTWDRLASQVAEAYQRRADKALGYESWADYAQAEFGEKTASIAAPIRRELVSTLSAEGMSTRAIAPAVGVSRQQIVNDRRASEVSTNLTPAPAADPEPHPSKSWSDFATAVEQQVNAQPAKVTGLDGKTYQKPKTPSPRRHSLVDDAVKASRDLAATAEKLRSIASDDRFTTNKSDIQDALRPAAALIREALQDLRITTN